MQRSRAPVRASGGCGEISSSVSSGGSNDAITTNEYSRQPPSRRSRSPSVIVRTAGTVMRHRRDLPWGIRLVQKLSDWFSITISPARRDLAYRISVLVITYFSYTAYHLSRKPISIVKNVLNQNCSLLVPPAGLPKNASNTWCDWAPFDGTDAETLLGTLDSSFLFAYAAGMFVSGFIAERVNLRYFLALGMLVSGFFTYLFGLAYSQGIHNITYFIFAQAMAGLFQTTGWPGVVTVVGNWFGKGKRGLIFGLWNSHTSLGNILGSVIAGTFVEDDWGLSFIVPGAIIGLMGFVVFLFLVPKPVHVGCEVPDSNTITGNQENVAASQQSTSTPRNDRSRAPPSTRRVTRTYGTVDSDSDNSMETSSESNYHIRDDTPLISSYLPYETPHADQIPTVQGELKIKAVGFCDALKIPGVIEYSLCLFFAKLVSYTFLYWLPRYIGSSTTLSAKASANLSTLFDFGGIFGGIIAGVISDLSGMNATLCAAMLGIAIPMLLVYESYGTESLWANIVLLIIVGLLVNGPYCLITTSISTELGTHPCLMGNARALATVVAIIDGTGSIGAAVGPLLAGPLSDFGWKYVFYMLMISDILALLLLSRLVSHEIKRLCETRRTNAMKMNAYGYSSLRRK